MNAAAEATNSRSIEGCEPWVGLFNGLADPLGFEAGDENLYRYVGNSPTNATDPTGLEEAVGHHYFPQRFLKLFFKEGIIDEDAFKLGMGYTSGPLTSHLYDDAHIAYSKRVATHFVKWANRHEGGPIGPDKLKVFIDKIASGKNPVTGKSDGPIEKYLAEEITKKLVGTAFDYTSVKELVERGANYSKTKQFLSELAESGAKRIFGKNVRKRLAKAIPIVGTVASAYFWSQDVEARGLVAGTINTGVDAVPVVGVVKAIGEIATGSNLIETHEDAEIREARWEVFRELSESGSLSSPNAFRFHGPNEVGQ